MTVAPTGLLSVPLSRMRDMVAASSNFQTWVGAETAAAAKASIPYEATDLSTAHCLIMIGDSLPIEALGRGTTNNMLPRGELKLRFYGPISEANQADFEDAFFGFTNVVGAVLADIMAISGGSGYLSIQDISPEWGPVRADEDDLAEETDFYMMQFSFEWGP